MGKAALNVRLGTDQQIILQRQLETGRYDDADAVVNDALRLMGEREAVLDAWLRDEVQLSLADETPAAPIDEAFERIRARLGQSAQAAKRGA